MAPETFDQFEHKALKEGLAKSKLLEQLIKNSLLGGPRLKKRPAAAAVSITPRGAKKVWVVNTDLMFNARDEKQAEQWAKALFAKLGLEGSVIGIDPEGGEVEYVRKQTPSKEANVRLSK